MDDALRADGLVPDSAFAAVDTRTWEHMLKDYEVNLGKLKDALLLKKSDKNTFCSIAYATGDVFDGFVDKSLDRIAHVEGDSDFAMISLIRFLYLEETKFEEVQQQRIRAIKERICQTLSTFPFWPTGDDKPAKDMSKLVFWSENHLFMTLGSAYLFYQYYFHSLQAHPPNYSPLVDEVFLKYLQLHLHPKFDGVYEANSHVYLPYTLSALFNLVDFAEERQIRSMAERVIDRIVSHVMLCTDPLRGVANLSVSARAFPRTRQRNFGHNINQLVNLMNGHSCDAFSASQLADFLVTTSWRPKRAAFEMLHLDGFVPQLLVSHRLADASDVYGYDVCASSERVVDEFMPLLWSAGLVAHPSFVGKTRLYQRRKNMLDSAHLWPLASKWISDRYYAQKLEKYTLFAAGQLYTDLRLNVYKEPTRGLVLSSFELFNAHNAGFQQLPWIANVSGIPVWSQAGLGGEGVLGFGMHNTHNPAVQQRGSMLVATYLAPTLLTNTIIVKNLFPSAVRLFWPKLFFEGEDVNERTALHRAFGNSKGRQHESEFYNCGGLSIFSGLQRQSGLHEMVWTAGRVRECFIGVLCTAQTRWDHNTCAEGTLQPTSTDYKLSSSRRVCDAAQHSWVVVVGSLRDYPNLRAFIDQRLLRVVISEVTGPMYELIVEDGTERVEYVLEERRPRSGPAASAVVV